MLIVNNNYNFNYRRKKSNKDGIFYLAINKQFFPLNKKVIILVN